MVVIIFGGWSAGRLRRYTFSERHGLSILSLSMPDFASKPYFWGSERKEMDEWCLSLQVEWRNMRNKLHSQEYEARQAYTIGSPFQGLPGIRAYRSMDWYEQEDPELERSQDPFSLSKSTADQHLYPPFCI